jgi:serine/alanine adding enzyme
MRVRLCKADDRESWEELVASCDDATSGHLWSWREVIARAYGFEPFYFVAEQETGKPLAAAPFIFVRSFLYGRELTSIPYVDYGGVCHRNGLTSDTAAAADRSIFDSALELAQRLGADRLQIRSPRPCDARFAVSTEKVTQHLALAGSAEEQLRRLPSERRNRLRHCERFRLTDKVGSALDAGGVAEFHSIYSENMRNLGSPTHSAGFFREVASRLKDRLSLIVIRHRGEAIAAAMALEFRGMLALPWSAATAAARRLYGSNALYWRAIRLAIERGCHTFDFGRSSVGSGIYEFKRRWGPEPRQAFWSTLYLKPGAKAPRERAELLMASALWRHMPLEFTRVLGPVLRKGISN